MPKPRPIGRFEILSEIARGGMGVVFKARDPVLGRDVALKVLLNPDPDPRFLQEARAATRLKHQGIVATYDLGTDDAGRDYLIMELVEGESLHARLKRDGPLPIGEAVAISLQLCDALAYAHAQGVIHRDMKPHNVLLTSGGVAKITDFGLGKVVNQSKCLTETGEVMGTPAYMPPEQAEGDKAAMGPHSDVYGLGATLYALLTGRGPFRGPLIQVLNAVLSTAPEPPSRYRPEVPPELDAIVLRCLAKAPDDRGTLDDLRGALQREEQAHPPEPATRAGPLDASSHRRPWGAAAGLSSLAVAAGFGAALATKGTTPPGTPPPAHERPALELPALEPDPSEEVLAESQAAYERGNAKRSLGDFAGAIAEYDEAIRLDPNGAKAWDAWVNRGATSAGLGDFTGAIADYDRALRLDPNHANAWVAYVNRGAAKAMLKDFAEAIRDYDEVLRRTPGRAAVWARRGDAMAALGDFAGATRDYDQAIRLSPSYANHWTSRANAKAKLGDAAGAIQDLDKAIRLSPSNAAAWVGRGSERAKLGDDEGALEDWRRALELRPEAKGASALRQRIADAQARLIERRP